jgi:excisionase family DNA binding protein
MPDREGEILTLDEVALYLKAGKRTVYRLAAGRDSGLQAGRHVAISAGRAGPLDRRRHPQEEDLKRADRHGG